MSAGPPRATVVVPVYGGVDLLDDCLASIPGWAEVVVVDDCSPDGLGDVVADRIAVGHPHVRLLRHDRNRGFGAACNTGMRAGSAPVRVVLNSDARLRPGALDALVAACALPGVGIAGARRVFPDGSHQTSAANFPTALGILAGSFLLGELRQRVRPGPPAPWQLGLSRHHHTEDRDVDWVSGTCLAVTEDCLAATGGFDERYHLYVEETDLCLRARRAGFRVRFVAGAVVEHLGGGSTGDPRRHAERFLRSEARFFRTAYGDGSLGRWRAARLLGSAVKVVLLAAPAAVDGRARARWRWHRSALALLRRWGGAGDGPADGAGATAPGVGG